MSKQNLQIDEELLKELELWHEEGKHEEIAEKLNSLPETKSSYALSMLLARAVNNLGKYEEGLQILLSWAEEGIEDKSWHFRVGYSLFFIDGREVESIAYFEKAIELGDNFPGTFELLLEAKKYLEDEQDSVEPEEFEFIPKAWVLLKLNMRLNPKHRHSYLEEGLDYMFTSKKWGKQTGGGTIISKEGEPESCDIEFEVAEYSAKMRDDILDMAKKLAIAKGSEIAYYNADMKSNNEEFDAEVKVGKLAGIGVYIKLDKLPQDEEQGQEAIAEVYSNLIDILKDNGACLPSYGENATEFGMYFYGERNFDYLKGKISDYLQSQPLTQDCRIVKLA